MSRVFILSPSERLNFTDAARFGALTYIYEDEERAPSPFLPGLFVEELEKRVMVKFGFDPSTDYLVLGGPVLNLALTLGFFAAEYEVLRVLAWDATRRCYVELLYDFS